MNDQLSFESARGCGLRVIGKVYLIGGKIGVSCDRLDQHLQECSCCGHIPTFHRGYQKIDPKIIFGNDHKACNDKFKPCPICQPNSYEFEAQSFMLYVGKKYYTPTTFLQEAKELGVCKAISNIPEGLVLGKSWIFLAYPELSEEIIGTDVVKGKLKVIKRDAIFHAFKAERIEVLITMEEATDENFLQALEEKGITPVIVPKNFEGLHAPKKAITFANKVYEAWKLEQEAKKKAQEKELEESEAKQTSNGLSKFMDLDENTTVKEIPENTIEKESIMEAEYTIEDDFEIEEESQTVEQKIEEDERMPIGSVASTILERFPNPEEKPKGRDWKKNLTNAKTIDVLDETIDLYLKSKEFKSHSEEQRKELSNYHKEKFRELYKELPEEKPILTPLAEKKLAEKKVDELVEGKKEEMICNTCEKTVLKAKSTQERGTCSKCHQFEIKQLAKSKKAKTNEPQPY